MSNAFDWPFDRPARLAVAAHARDQDDLHFGTVTHPGGVVWSAVAACALEEDLPVADAIGAAAFGYELIVRLAEAAGPEHRQRWHATATSGTVGAAGAASRLVGCDWDGVVNAVAHAISVAGGAAHAIAERTSTRFLHRAHATVTGLACARAARTGKSASRHILETGRGTFVLSFPERLTAVRDKTGIEETGFRLHEATGFSQSAIDAALSIGRAGAGEIESVQVSVSSIAAALASNPTPRGADEEWWSIEFAVAMTLGCDIGQIDVQPTQNDWAARLDVTLRDGSTRRAYVNEPRGHPDRPASKGDLLAKWARLTGTTGTKTLELIETVDDGSSFAEIIREAVPTLF